MHYPATTANPATPETVSISDLSGSARRRSIVSREERGRLIVDPGPLAAELRRAVLLSGRRLRKQKPTSELTDGQYAVLGSLSRCGSATPSALAEQERIRPPAMTRTIAALEDAGFVERTADPADRRQVLVSLTQAGNDLVTKTRAMRTAWLAERLAKLSERDRRVLSEAAVILNREVAAK